MSDEKKINFNEFMDAVSKLENQLEKLKDAKSDLKDTNENLLKDFNWKGTSKEHYSSEIAEKQDKNFEKLNTELSQCIQDLINTSKTIDNWDKETAQSFQN